MRKVLVTGAGGFIGWHFSNDLARKGHDVTGVDLGFPEGSGTDEAAPWHSVTGDFRDRGLMEGLLESVEVVVHLASAHLQISLPESEYWDINVHSLRPFLEAAQKSGVGRFVHVSSVGAYGNLKKFPADEKTPCRPQSIYGETKVAGEAEVQRFSKETGFPIVVLRPAWVYGPACPRTAKLYKALRKGRFIMIGKGENLRHPIYISDMLEALQLAMEQNEAVGEMFVIGGERAITTNELVDAFCSVLGVPRPRIRIPFFMGLLIASTTEMMFGLLRKEPPLSRRTLEFFDTNNSFDISKAKRLLGFNPKYNFDDGLRESREWLISKS